MNYKLIEIFKDYSTRLNLLSRGDRELLEQKHFPDALEVLKIWTPENGSKIADIGTGGGLPGLVLASELPECEFTLIDARQKKVEAVEGMAKEAGLKNVTGRSGRFEVIAREEEYREQFDFVTARAVASLPVLLEYAAPFLKVGGQLLAWKGPSYTEDLNKAREAMEILEMDLETEHPYLLPTGEERVILVFKKIDVTPEKYPRPDGRPKKSPL
ncbi:MAG: 16S rRNA (guanine527-N7)-methyltransferase [Oceanicoccus sp.]|jgi:16S rRNA (guanine527-N7)-methyltransferase